MIYQYHSGFGTDPEVTVLVTHTCGHSVAYEYGGTHDNFREARRRFSEAQQRGRCPDCTTIDNLPSSLVALPGPIPLSGGKLEERNKKAVYVADEPVIIQRLDETGEMPPHPLGYYVPRPSYSYATTALDPSASYGAWYLHARPGHVYTPAERTWLDEYRIQSLAKPKIDGSYCFGATLSNWYQIEEAERRIGKPIALNNNDIDRVSDAEEDSRITKTEAALELACESGLIGGAI